MIDKRAGSFMSFVGISLDVVCVRTIDEGGTRNEEQKYVRGGEKGAWGRA
jgi:hypothetical protein